MPDLNVGRNQVAKLSRVEGKLKVGKKATILASDDGQSAVVVTEGAYFEGAAEIKCNFQCDSLKVGGGGVLKVRGDLIVLKRLDVVHSIEANGSIRAEEIDVGGKIYAKTIECKSMRAGGIVEAAESFVAESVSVGGKVIAPRSVRITDLEVGGQANLGGGVISGRIRVGGRFESRSRLEVGDLQVYGHTTFGDSTKGRRISTYGKVSVSGDLECEETMDVSGVTEIHGNCVAKKIGVDGKLSVSGSLRCTEAAEILGLVEVQREFNSPSLKVGGRFEAAEAIVSGEVDLAGMAETVRGLRSNAVVIRSGSRCKGPIIGDRVEVGRSGLVLANWNKRWAGQVAALHMIGRMTHVEDIYAREVQLGSASRSGRVYAEVVEVDKGAIAEEILYTKELRGPVEKGFFQSEPRKVSDLPRPPSSTTS